MNDPTIARTPNPNCGACVSRRYHDELDWTTFHKFAGHGFTPEQGWTHPELGPARFSPPPSVNAQQAAPVSGSTPLVFHAEDGGQLLCRTASGFWAKERLEVTCAKCLEILNR